MADYHILTQDIEKKTMHVVYHVPVPEGGENQAGITWRDAIVLDAGGSDNINTSMPSIDLAELTAMKAGALVEVVKNRGSVYKANRG